MKSFINGFGSGLGRSFGRIFAFIILGLIIGYVLSRFGISISDIIKTGKGGVMFL